MSTDGLNIDNSNDAIESIRDSYTFLQASLFFDLMAQTALKNVSEQLQIDDPPFTIDFDTGEQYKLRNEYIIRALLISNSKPRNFGLISQVALLQCFSEILSKTFELLDTENAGSQSFKEYCHNILGDQFDSFHTIIRLFRNVFVHSISRDYILKLNDFAGWKRAQLRNNISEVRLNVTITNTPPQAIDIKIIVDEIKEGIKIWDIIGTGGILMLIELIMNLCFHFESKMNNKI